MWGHIRLDTLFVLARGNPSRIVAVLDESNSTPGKSEAVGGVHLHSLAINALPEAVTVGYVADDHFLSLTWVKL